MTQEKSEEQETRRLQRQHTGKTNAVAEMTEKEYLQMRRDVGMDPDGQRRWMRDRPHLLLQKRRELAARDKSYGKRKVFICPGIPKGNE